MSPDSDAPAPVPPPVPPPPVAPAAETPATTAVPSSRSLSKLTLVAALAGVVVFALVVFAGIRMATHTSNVTTAPAGSQGSAPAGPGGAGRGRGRGVMGPIASIDGATFTVTGSGGPVKVVTTATTVFTSSSPGTLSDIKFGQNVAVVGTTTDSNIAADRITDTGTMSPAAAAGFPGGFQAGGRGNGTGPDGPPGQPGQPGQPPQRGQPNQHGGSGQGSSGPAGQNRRFVRPVTGTVLSVDATGFKLTDDAGTIYTVTTSANTTVTVVKESSLSALKVGSTIRAIGSVGSDGTVTAASVREGAFPPNAGGGPPGLGG